MTKHTIILALLASACTETTLSAVNPRFACWDANQDNIRNAEEDLNADGFVDTMDCAHVTACWDANENGLADAAEDLNGDEQVDYRDCQGAAGADGAPGQDGADGLDGLDGAAGAPGQNGAQGLDGLDGTNGQDGSDGQDGINGQDGGDGQDGSDGMHCWDVNMDGVNDEAEDVNGDEVFDTLDCVSNFDDILDRLDVIELVQADHETRIAELEATALQFNVTYGADLEPIEIDLLSDYGVDLSDPGVGDHESMRFLVVARAHDNASRVEHSVGTLYVWGIGGCSWEPHSQVDLGNQSGDFVCIRNGNDNTVFLTHSELQVDAAHIAMLPQVR